MVFCVLTERRAFWKVTLSANIAAWEICPPKELIICLLSQNSTFLHSAEIRRKTDSCSPGCSPDRGPGTGDREFRPEPAALHASRAAATGAPARQPRKAKLSGSLFLKDRLRNRIREALLKEMRRVRILPLNLPRVPKLLPRGSQVPEFAHH